MPALYLNSANGFMICFRDADGGKAVYAPTKDVADNIIGYILNNGGYDLRCFEYNDEEDICTKEQISRTTTTEL